ncbi:MAG: hypothetical protein AB7U38_14970, partial [Hyphomicrobiales bacterium]
MQKPFEPTGLRRGLKEAMAAPSPMQVECPDSNQEMPTASPLIVDNWKQLRQIRDYLTELDALSAGDA